MPIKIKTPKRIEQHQCHCFFLGLIAEKQQDAILQEKFHCEGSVVSQRDNFSFDELDDSSISDISGDWSHSPSRKRAMRSSRSSRSRIQLRSDGAVPPPDNDESPAKQTRGTCLTKPLSRDSAVPVKTKTHKSVTKKDELPANTAIMVQSKSTNLRSKKNALPAGTSTAAGTEEKKHTS
jgi:hypothetical protein